MSFAAQTYGDETYNSEPTLALASASPARVSRAGGTIVTLSGVFRETDTFLVSVDGIQAYSGIEGQKFTVKSIGGSKIQFVVPQIPTPGNKAVFVSGSPSGENGTIFMDVLERNFGNSPSEIRRKFAPWQLVGPRRLELEPKEPAAV